MWKDKTVQVSDATGTVKSIREWGAAAFGVDRKQRRAFEVLVSAFLLTFYNEPKKSRNDPSHENRAKYRSMMNALRKLRGIKKPTICFAYCTVLVEVEKVQLSTH